MIDFNIDTTKASIPKNNPSIQNASHYYDMIVFCHLRWQCVYKRPQHIISRMAKTMKVLFIEEPMPFNANETSGNFIIINEMLHVLQPNVKDIRSIADIIPNYVSNTNIPIGWFYSAAFCHLLETMNFENVVYDCMDELSLIKNAHLHLIYKEKYLMSQADFIFTGGKSLYESKKQHYKNMYCFPSSVDRSHFSKALNGITIPEDITQVTSPIVGYYGVIDERINYQLLKEAAEKLPRVSFVMIGPLANIEESNLPQASNIHYLGMKSYDDLPHYLKAFDIAMMPFALNDATKCISPTKTLEYMAAHKPIISTKIVDVVRDYSMCVSLIDSSDQFCDAIQLFLVRTNRLFMEMEYHRILKKTSWDITVDKMKMIMKTFAT